jgi:hypothetical protein
VVLLGCYRAVVTAPPDSGEEGSFDGAGLEAVGPDREVAGDGDAAYNAVEVGIGDVDGPDRSGEPQLVAAVASPKSLAYDSTPMCWPLTLEMTSAPTTSSCPGNCPAPPLGPIGTAMATPIDW